MSKRPWGGGPYPVTPKTVKHPPALVPAHWPIEIMNALVTAVRRGRIDRDRVARFVRDLAALRISIEPPRSLTVWERVIGVALSYRLTVYDATYLELAERSGLPLATLDDDLRNAAFAAGVALVET